MLKSKGGDAPSGGMRTPHRFFLFLNGSTFTRLLRLYLTFCAVLFILICFHEAVLESYNHAEQYPAYNIFREIVS